MRFAKDSKVVFIGDSITDCGRTQPVGEGLFGAFGNGWVNAVVGLLGAAYPELRLRLVNMGTSGNTTRDLLARWDRDVTALAPDWVACMIGTDDVWRQFDLPLHTEIHVGPEEFRANLEALVDRTLPKVRGMILLTPFYLEPERKDAMRARMDLYGDVARETASSRGTLLVDTQAAMDALLRHDHSSAISWDRVHPSIVGHTAIARAFLDAIGFDWSAGRP